MFHHACWFKTCPVIVLWITFFVGWIMVLVCFSTLLGTPVSLVALDLWDVCFSTCAWARDYQDDDEAGDAAVSAGSSGWLDSVRYGFRSVLNSQHGDFNGFFFMDFKHQNHETLGDRNQRRTGWWHQCRHVDGSAWRYPSAIGWMGWLNSMSW